MKVVKVNTIKNKSKTKIVRGKLSKKKGFKKALITLKKVNQLTLLPEYKNEFKIL